MWKLILGEKTHTPLTIGTAGDGFFFFFNSIFFFSPDFFSFSSFIKKNIHKPYKYIHPYIRIYTATAHKNHFPIYTHDARTKHKYTLQYNTAHITQFSPWESLVVLARRGMTIAYAAGIIVIQWRRYVVVGIFIYNRRYLYMYIYKNTDVLGIRIGSYKKSTKRCKNIWTERICVRVPPHSPLFTRRTNRSIAQRRVVIWRYTWYILT